MMTTMDNNTTTTAALTPSPFTGNQISVTARAVFASVGLAMIVCGVTGNMFLITVIIRRFQRKRHVHNLFIANLALADILTLGYWLTFFVLDLILGYHPVVNQTHCVVNGVMVGVFSVVSTLSLVSISLNRYLHVVHCHLYSRTFTLPRTVLACLLTWVLGTALALPPALLDRGPTGAFHYNALTHICSFNRQGLTYPKIMVIFFSTVPMLFIGYWNFAIFRFWRKARMSVSSRFPPLSGKDDRAGGKFVTYHRRPREKKEKGEGAEAEGCQPDSGLSKNDGAADNTEISGTTIAEEESDLFGNDENTNEISEPKSAYNENSTVRFAGSADTIKNRRNAVGETEHVIEGDAQKDDTNKNASFGVGHAHQLQGMEDGRKGTVIKALDDIPENEQQYQEEGMPKMKRTVAEESSNPPSKTNVSRSKTVVVESPKVIKTPASSSSTLSLKRARSRLQKGNLSTAVQSLQQQRKKQRAREVAFVRSLFVVFILMSVCFVPYGVSIVISSFMTIPPEAVILGIMFLFTNNTINWIVYGVMNSAFRKGYAECMRHMLVTCCRIRENRTPRFLNASQTSLTTASVARFNTDNDLEQSSASHVASIAQ